MSNSYKDIIRCLADLGFSEREAKVYHALLSKRSASAAELQKLSGVPQSKIYEVIDGLVRSGYCTERKIGRKKTFEVVKPDLALDSAFKGLRERLENTLTFKSMLQDLYDSRKEVSEPLEYIEVYRGNDNIHHKYCRLVKNTRKEILGFGRQPYACDTSDKASDQTKVEAAATDRGVDSRWVNEIILPEEAWLLPDLKKLKAKGQGIRIAEKLPLKMMIFDQEHLLVAEEEPYGHPGELTMSLIKQPTVVNAFKAMFEYFWDHSIDLDQWIKAHITEIPGSAVK